MDIKQTCKEVNTIAKEKGFWDEERNVGELLMLIVSELGEAIEAHRKDKFANSELYEEQLHIGAVEQDQVFETFMKDTFEDEIADSVIRLFDLAEGLDIDLEWHISEKMKYNSTREKLHGKAY